MTKHRENSDYTIAAEYQALNLCIHTPATDFVKEYFPHEEAQDIFQAIQILKDKEERITASSLFREANLLNDSIDNSLINTIYEYHTDLSSLDSVLQTLKEASVKYRVRELASQIVDKTSSADPLDAQSLSNLIYEAQDTLVNGNKKIVSKTLEHCLEEYEKELNDRAAGKLYSFADTHLDSILLRKAAPGQIILIAGATGTGKSAFTLNIINGMINSSIPTMYFSLEMDTISTMDRLISMRTDIPTDEWYNKDSIPSLKRKLEREKELLKSKPFRLIDDATLSLDQIQSLIREFKMTYKTEYACIFIDLVTQVRDFTNLKGQGTLANTIEFSVNRLNAMAKSENVCFVCVSQLNRETDSAKLHSIEEIEAYRPTLNQIKNSHALGERSRTVLSVFRPKYYAERLFPEDEILPTMEDILQVQVLKQSQSAAGTVRKYIFDGSCFQIKPLLEDELDAEDSSS